MPQLILATLALALAPLACWAQTAKDSWDNLKQLQPGHTVKVVDMKYKSWSGKLVSVTVDAITIRGQRKQEEITVERANVLRVTDLHRSRRGRNALIGFGIGAAIGTPIGAAHSSDLPDSVGALIMMGMLGGAGAGIGAAVPSYPTLYRAPPPNPNP